MERGGDPEMWIIINGPTYQWRRHCLMVEPVWKKQDSMVFEVLHNQKSLVTLFSCDIWFVITVLFTKSISIENVIGHYITINWLILATSFDWHMVSDDIKLRPGARQRKYQIFFLLVFSSCSFHQIQPKSNVTYYRSRWAYEYAINVRSTQWKLSDHIVKDSYFFVRSLYCWCPDHGVWYCKIWRSTDFLSLSKYSYILDTSHRN